jgi:hypothetical protein
MENLNLSELTIKYFQMEQDIEKMNIQKEKYQEEINEQYNIKGNIYLLIKKKQKEQEDEIEENKKKLKESLENAQLKKAQMKREKLEKAIEERKKRESDPEYIKKKEQHKQFEQYINNSLNETTAGYWYAVDGTMTQKIKKNKPPKINIDKDELYKNVSFCNFE